jgi:hypothetical protein
MTVFATLSTNPNQSFRKHSMPGFEMRSVLLIGALSVAAIAAHAQTPAATPSHTSPANPPTQMSPQGPAGNAGRVPANKTSSKDVDAAFDKADANHDGRLNRKEAEDFPAVAQRFEQLDSNHDTFVSRDELAKATSGS